MKETFKRDLKAGKEVEKLILTKIHEKYPEAYMTEGKFSEYDIYIPEISNSVEVKCDRKSKETGNIVIEIAMFGRASGICATTADYWVFADGERLMWTTPRQIKNCILYNNVRQVTFTGKGDREPKRAYLVPIHLIEEISKIQDLVV